jgi:predicted nucleic acid-binding protein
MPGKRKKYYWCSWAFISWLNGRASADDMEGLAEIVKQVEKGDAILITSAVMKTEVLEGKMTEDERERFKKLLQRRDVVLVDLTSRVIDLATKIREWNSKISTPDAYHLATAILYEAEEFHTNDGGGKRKRAGDLIPLSGNVMSHNLKICKPRATQRKPAIWSRSTTGRQGKTK